MSWPQYLRFLLATTGLLAVALYAFILVLDPYQNVPFSPPLARAPVSTNQRYAYPALARDPAFDSAILGTSTMRLIDPQSLGQALGARFVSLAMNSATAYEQSRLHEVLVRHHPALRYLVLGIDETWCNRRADVADYTFRAFPEWMYDRDAWNDLPYLFNDKALEDAVRMLELLAGWREPKYRLDGYRDFTLDFPPYDRLAVRRRLYRSGDVATAAMAAEIAPSLEHAQWHYPLHRRLFDLIDATPETTRIVLLWPPLHAHYLAPNSTSLAECKGRIESFLAGDRRIVSLDYMRGTALTRDDDNYWDPLHFKREVAARIERDVSAVVHGRGTLSRFVRVGPWHPDPLVAHPRRVE